MQVLINHVNNTLCFRVGTQIYVSVSLYHCVQLNVPLGIRTVQAVLKRLGSCEKSLVAIIQEFFWIEISVDNTLAPTLQSYCLHRMTTTGPKGKAYTPHATVTVSAKDVS